MTKTRGQAALEFLSTYGFAFLVILVMIGALSYFGVLSPGRFLPERCLVNAEFTCAEFQIQQGGTVTFVLQNNLGNSVIFDNSSFFATSDFAETNATNGCTVNPGTITGGALSTVTCTLDQPAVSGGTAILPAAGEKVRVRFNGMYTELGRTLPRTLQGEVFATVQ